MFNLSQCDKWFRIGILKILLSRCIFCRWVYNFFGEGCCRSYWAVSQLPDYWWDLCFCCWGPDLAVLLGGPCGWWSLRILLVRWCVCVNTRRRVFCRCISTFLQIDFYFLLCQVHMISTKLIAIIFWWLKMSHSERGLVKNYHGLEMGTKMKSFQFKTFLLIFIIEIIFLLCLPVFLYFAAVNPLLTSPPAPTLEALLPGKKRWFTSMRNPNMTMKDIYQ